MTTVSPADHSFSDAWNEAYAAPGRPRPPYVRLLRELGRVDVALLSAGVGDSMEAAGATFGADPFGVCPVPRMIETREWSALSEGLTQRVRALSAFVLDAYGERSIVTAGVVPANVIDGAEGYEPELRGRWPQDAAPLGVVGLDVVREPDGELRVLEDNTRTPSGFSYAVAVRNAVSAAFGTFMAEFSGATPAPLPLEPAVLAGLRATLRDAAGTAQRTRSAAAGEACVVVLTDGPDSSAFFEHATVARWLGAPIVTVQELERRGNELWLRPRSAGRARRVHVVYRRTDTDSLRDEHGRRTPIAELLLEPWLAGRMALVNAFGTGVADDKLAHAYVEQMIRFYLGEEPLLRSVQTLDLNDPMALEQVLDDLHNHVIKPRYGHGGHGVVVCAQAAEEDVKRVERELGGVDAGARYVAQRTVSLSLAPTVIGDGLAERHIDLRPFAFATRERVEIVPGGLTRVARQARSLVVNSSQNGGAKDTWVLP